MTFDIEFWKFINTFAPWLSALGTIAAVVVSLYLARRDKTIRLEVSAGHRLMVTPGVKGPHPEYLVVRVVNIGHREAQITNIGWKIGLFRRQHAIQTTINDGISSRIPVRLKDGEEANFFIPLDEHTNWLRNFARDFLEPFPKMSSRFIKVQVFTSVGRNFEQRIEKGLREVLVKVAKKMSSRGHR